jgi:splicing factor 3B subunit 2
MASVDVGGGAAVGPADADADFDAALLNELLAQQGVAAGGTARRKAKPARKRARKADGERLGAAGGGGEDAGEGDTAPAPAAAAAGDAVAVEFVVPDMASVLKAAASSRDSAREAALLNEFAGVFDRFAKAGVEGEEGEAASDAAGTAAAGTGAAAGAGAGGDPSAAGAAGQGAGGKPAKLSKKARREMLQLSLAELKRVVDHPEVVEAPDVTAADPLFLIHLKSARNTVPVPRHWSQKSRYLARKRGFEKPPFALPDFITATGITKMRNEDLEAGAEKTLKSKTRERFLPKMGKMEIDLQVLYDAFFRHQTRPKLQRFGDMYYQGREFELRFPDKRPGFISDRLREALGMQPGFPPPWLFKMQQFGPPPAYPGLRIPGVNAPLPPGAQYGPPPTGWGTPPLDNFGRPLYGDVYGTSGPSPEDDAVAAEKRKGHWGEYVISREEMAASYARAAAKAAAAAGVHVTREGEGDAPAAAEGAGAAAAVPDAAAMAAGTETPADGALSVANTITTGMATPDVVDIRKGPRRLPDGMETPESVASAPPPQVRVPGGRGGGGWACAARL